MKRYLLVGLALIIGAATAFAGSGYVGSELAVLEISGVVIDTHKELILPKEGGNPYFFIGGMTICVKDWVPSGPPIDSACALSPVFTAYMKQKAAKLRAGNCLVDCEDILKKHRKPLGLGVHGPLKIKGKLRLSFDTYEDRTQMVAVMEAEELKGPKGTWTANK